MSLTDARRMWKLADERGAEGLHSHEARKLGISGNPSQRAKDIADHVPFWTVRESRNGRPGSRYFTDGNQPPDAIAVRPNGTEGGGGTASSPAGDSPAPLSVEAAESQVGVKQPVALFRDYTRPETGWREVPVDEHGWPIERAA